MNKVLAWLVSFLCAFALVACGGGGGSAGTPVLGGASSPTTGSGTGVTLTPTLTVTLSSSTVTAAAPVTVTSTLKDSLGVAIAGQVLTYKSTNGLGSFSANTALTNASGVATVTLVPASSTANGADNVVVTTTVGTIAVSGQQGFQLTATTAANTSPTLTLSLSSSTVTAAVPATLTATLKDSLGAGIAGRVLTFTTTGGLGSFSAATALTNDSGVALVRLFPTSASASGADSVVVSTTINSVALSAQQGFQLAATNVTISSFSSDLSASASVSAYGQTNLTVALAGAAAGAPVSVSISSSCVSKGKATLTPTTVSTTSGSASFTYRDNGCGATDSVDPLQATVVGSSASSSLSLGLTTPLVNSIKFNTASPQTIYLKGSGYAESSLVSFLVLDQNGNPLQNQSVLLEPTTLTGGLTLDGRSASVTKKSDSSGVVSVTVNSGTVPTPMRVKATLVSSTTIITTVSSSLAIAVGLPSQLNFSMSQKTINIEGGDVDGTSNTYSVIASDRLGNPVPDGTAINFISEAGQIQAIGLTTGNPLSAGTTAQFQSSSPRSADGRVTVMAYALGEESFLDLNGNNVYDAGEPFQDLGNLFLSRFSLGTYNPLYDQFISLSISGNATCAAVSAVQDPVALLSLNASIPSIPGTCDGVWGKAYVRRSIETVFSRSSARPVWGTTRLAGLDASCAVVALNDDDHPYPSTSTAKYYVVGPGGLSSLPAIGSFSFVLADRNPVRLNPMAAGTTVTATATSGFTATVTGGGTVPSTSNASVVSVTYDFGTTTSATVTLQITSPGGLVTSVPILLKTTAAGAACLL